MCGIAGFITKKNISNNILINKFKESLKHRGPDDNGHYIHNNSCVINTRLSIIDIENGSQPFVDQSNQIIVVQNGEIYNYIEIKEKLIKQGVNFLTNSDTEVILKLYENFGIDSFKMLNGMFSIAIIDKRNNKLILARDRLGVKPLYLYTKNDEIFFSSEIKTFLKISDFDKSIDFQSIHNYLKFNYIPLPKTIFKNVSHLDPGCFIEISLNTMKRKKKIYWDINNEPEKTFNDKKIFNELDEILYNAIKIRLRSDVKIGSFLSGGLDSSLVCAMTKKHFNVSLESYSIGFDDLRFDESSWAKKVADYCGIKNNVMTLKSNIISDWEKTTFYNDQPHGDISFIPTFILSKFTSKDYKLVLTGDGGDEAFGGYEKYLPNFNDDFYKYFNSISLVKNDKIFDDLYTEDFRNHIDINQPFEIFKQTVEKVDKKDFKNQILYFDMKQLLPGNNLVKPDKMAMANSLEARSPMLDYRLFEYVNKMPGDLKFQNNVTKYFLKKFALKYLPNDIVFRKKQMFTVPVGEWFKTSLSEYLNDLLRSKSFINRNIINDNFLKKMITEHNSKSGKDYTRELRALANLEIWYRTFVD